MGKHRSRCVVVLIRVALGHARWGGTEGCGEFQTSRSGIVVTTAVRLQSIKRALCFVSV